MLSRLCLCVVIAGAVPDCPVRADEPTKDKARMPNSGARIAAVRRATMAP
jgi:hypothetical protein